MPNLAIEFQSLIEKDPLLIGDVVETLGVNQSIVQILGGTNILVQGSSWIAGTRVFVRNNVITGEAPALSFFEVEV